MIIYIENTYDFHYEIIESVINKYNFIIKKDKTPQDKIFLNTRNNTSFLNYILTKYSNIITISPDIIKTSPDEWDYYINCTVYDKDFDIIKASNQEKQFYISHKITNRLGQCKNVYFITPLCNSNRFFYADILPFVEKKYTARIPIYIIQGNINNNRRNYTLLDKILEYSLTSPQEFKIKIIGRGQLDEKYDKYNKTIILKNNLNFEDYHKEFLDGYCILPLISKQSHPQYYSNKLTSTISYGKAYNLLFLIDKDLQNIYKLDNVEIYENNILDIFIKTLKDFYIKNKPKPNRLLRMIKI